MPTYKATVSDYKWFKILIICNIIAALFGGLYCRYAPIPRDYTGLTVYEDPIPDIAIDIEKEYKDDYIRLLWQQAKERGVFE